MSLPGSQGMSRPSFTLIGPNLLVVEEYIETDRQPFCYYRFAGTQVSGVQKKMGAHATLPVNMKLSLARFEIFTCQIHEIPRHWWMVMQSPSRWHMRKLNLMHMKCIAWRLWWGVGLFPRYCFCTNKSRNGLFNLMLKLIQKQICLSAQLLNPCLEAVNFKDSKNVEERNGSYN